MNQAQIDALIKEKEDLIFQFKQQENADYHEILAGRLTEYQAKTRKDDRANQIQRLEGEIAELRVMAIEGGLAGWVEVTPAYLEEKQRHEPPQIPVTYFNGGSPNWGLITSKVIPRRNQFDKLIRTLHEIAETRDMPIILLTGPSGEGKSTAIRQVIYELVEKQSRWRILWREPEKINYTSLEKVVDYVLSQPASEDLWLICADGSKPLLDSLGTATAKIREAGRTDIYFLLSSRGIDWQRSPAKNRLYSLYKEISIMGLDRDDAVKIVRAWKDYGTLETLRDDTEAIAAQKLFDAAHGGSTYESFLGAMLSVRVGKNLRRFVGSIISQLAQLQEETGYKLLDAFIYIAVVHALDLKKDLLTDTVLAGVLKTSPEHIHEIIISLGREAAATLDGDYIVTRHIKIAQEAVKILNEDYEGLGDNRLALINKLAVKGFVKRSFVNSEIGRWNYLSKDVFKRNKQLGIRLAKAVCEGDEKDAFLIVNLATLYRNSDDSEKAIQLLKEKGTEVKRVHRAYYYEWATNEGILGNLAADIFLSALSVSDQVNDELTGPSAKMSLAGVSKALLSLSGQAAAGKSAEVLLIAAGAAVQMGLPLPIGDRATGETQVQLEDLWAQLEKRKLTASPHKKNIENFIAGVTASQSNLNAELPSWVPQVKSLRFTKLYDLLREYP
jgi:DNA polymerase III delta prime subunit